MVELEKNDSREFLRIAKMKLKAGAV